MCNLTLKYVELDVQKAINLLVDDSTLYNSLTPLIMNCRKLMLEFNKFKIRHIFHETNGVIDVLAKEPLNFEDTLLILVNPL